MEFVPLALFAIAVVGLGAAATVLLADWIPESVSELASEHGRFVGLGEPDGRAPAPYHGHGQAEAMNVVRTSS